MTPATMRQASGDALSAPNDVDQALYDIRHRRLPPAQLEASMGQKKMLRLEDLQDRDLIWFYSLAQNDLQLALDAARLAIDRRTPPLWSQDPLYSCLHDAAVTRYMRPFCGCDLPDGQSKTCLPASIMRSPSDESLEKVHEMIRTTRHQLVAHSDMSAKDVVIQPLAAQAGGPNWRVFTSTGMLSPPQLAALMTCANTALHRVIADLARTSVDLRARVDVGQTYSLRDGAPVNFQ